MAKKKKFQQEVVSYDSPAVETPYLKAKKEWDDRIGSARVQAAGWRLVALLSLLVAIVLLVVVVMALALHKNTVYVAEVTKAGQVVNVKPLEIPYNPTQAQQEYFVSNFIKESRSLPLDPVVAKKNWVKAYDHLTQRSAAEYSKMMKKADLIKLLGKETITVKISAVNPMSANTYQVNWSETTVNMDGKTEKEKKYSGVFTTVVKQPTTSTEILKNPLGLYISNFDVSTRD